MAPRCSIWERIHYLAAEGQMTKHYKTELHQRGRPAARGCLPQMKGKVQNSQKMPKARRAFEVQLPCPPPCPRVMPRSPVEIQARDKSATTRDRSKGICMLPSWMRTRLCRLEFWEPHPVGHVFTFCPCPIMPPLGGKTM